MPDKETTQALPANEHTAGETSESVQRVALVSSSPSARSIVRVVVIVLLLLSVKDVVVLILTSLTHLLFMVVLAILLSYLINPLVGLIERPFETSSLGTTMRRTVSIALSFIIVFAVLVVAVAFLSPQVSDQAKNFVTNIPNYTTALQTEPGLLDGILGFIHRPKHAVGHRVQMMPVLLELFSQQVGMVRCHSFIPPFVSET
jgi:predicted PurR-regulated permease PerM